MDKRQLIKNATLKLFKTQGIVTTREIASLADVNVASINYYFKSKTQLINEVEELIVSDLKHIMSTIESDSKNLDELKLSFANQLYAFTLDAPGFFIHALNSFTTSNNSSDANFASTNHYFKLLRQFLDTLLSRYSDIKDQSELNNRTIIFMTSLTVSLITAGALTNKNTSIPSNAVLFKDKDFFISYVSSLIDLIIK